MLEGLFLDELQLPQFEEFLATHMSKRVLPPILNKPNSVWWDDSTTSETVETQAIIVQKAFEKTIRSLEKDFGANAANWTWNKVHTLEHGHPIGEVAALRSFFNVGPFEVHGSRELINNLSFGYTADGFFKVGSGPSTRRVVDFSDVENSMSILPTGQSGNPFSKYYSDQAELFQHGKFRKMMMNETEIKSKAASKLTFMR